MEGDVAIGIGKISSGWVLALKGVVVGPIVQILGHKARSLIAPIIKWNRARSHRPIKPPPPSMRTPVGNSLSHSKRRGSSIGDGSQVEIVFTVAIQVAADQTIPLIEPISTPRPLTSDIRSSRSEGIGTPGPIRTTTGFVIGDSPSSASIRSTS